MINKSKKVLELRKMTSAGMVDCMRALETFNGDVNLAKDYLISKYGEKALKKSDRKTNEGMVAHYVHSNNKIGSMVVLRCETDFVARNANFKQLAYDIAMHVAAMNPVSIDTLLEENFIKDTSLTIKDCIHQVISQTGENIVLEKFTRFEI